MFKNSAMTQSMIKTIAGKAIGDLKSGGMRGTRNMLELCCKFATTPFYQEFWGFLKELLTVPDNHYSDLMQRISRTVHEETLKTLTVNLGYNAFSYGREQLLARYAQLGAADLWLQRMDVSQSLPDADVFSQWNDKGVFVFLMEEIQSEEDVLQILKMAAKNQYSIFALKLTHGVLGEVIDSQAMTQEQENVCFLMEDAIVPEIAAAMQKRKLFFGFSRNYCEVESIEEERALMQEYIANGYIMGVYQDKEVPTEYAETLYREMTRSRFTGASEIFLCDLERDAVAMQRVLLGMNQWKRQ
ncbi:MAG: hypothetical protein RSF73_09420 [Ruthenibacterium sp.]